MSWLRRRFIIATVILVLMALLSGAYVVRELNLFAHRQAEQQLLETTRALSLVLDGEFRHYETLLKVLAGSESLARGDYRRFDAEARAQLAGPGAWIVLGDRRGRQFVNTRLPAGALLPSSPPPRHVFSVLDKGQPHVCNLAGGLIAPRVLCIDVPVMRGGRADFHLSVVIEPSTLQKIIDDQKVPDTRFATIIDRRGIVVWRNIARERFIGRPATRDILDALRRRAEDVKESVSLEGVPTVVAYSRSRSGLSFIVAVPQAEIDRGVASATRRGLIMGGVMLLLTFLAAVVAGRRLTVAIASLSATADYFGRGVPAAFRRTGIPEVDEVGEAMRRAIAERDISDERFELAQEVGGVGAWDWDVPHDVGTVSSGYRRLHGIEHLKPLRLQQIIDVVHPDDRDAYRARLAEGMKRRDPTTNEYRVVHGDGSIRWVAVKGRVVRDEMGRPLRAVGIVRDITAERQAQAALAESEERLRLATDGTGIGIYDLDVTKREGIWSARAFELLGLEPSPDGVGRYETWAERVHPDDRARILAIHERHADSGDSWEAEYRIVRADTGEVRWLHAHGRFMQQGPSLRSIGVVADTTERKLLAEQLERLTQALQATVEKRTVERDRLWQLSRDPFVIADRDGKWLAASQAWTDILGWSQDELIGRTSAWMEPPEDRRRSEAETERLAAGHLALNFTNRFLARDGSYRWFSWNTVPDGDRFYSVARDVTEERARAEALERTREALVQSQKLEAMGKLTGGVAHDVNNLLTPILASLDFLQGRELPDERSRQLVGAALTATERARLLVQRLLAFARRQPLRIDAVDVCELVGGIRDLIGTTLGPQYQVMVSAPDHLPPVRADQSQLEMALLNLAVNARDAMPDGGTLVIAVEPVPAGRERRTLAQGSYIKLSVTDTGVGMTPDVASRAIEPFFTTKGVGKGTGLGLSMVHGLMAQLGGELAIVSTSGVGTTIELWLPQADTVAPAPQPLTGTQPRRSTGSALLVDDELLVRESVGAMLHDLGYVVVEAAEGVEALAMIEQGLTFDLLVTDHLMPGMTGSELARTVRARSPMTRILVISGYADVEDMALDLPRLTKPFRLDELASMLAAAGDSLAPTKA
jgi:PAS domain S-box-containing protein